MAPLSIACAAPSFSLTELFLDKPEFWSISMSFPLLKRSLALLILLFVSHAAFAHGYKLGDLDIHHPWTRATPPGADVAGGFMEITNGGTLADRLISVEIDGIPMAQIHEMTTSEGVMKMRPLANGLDIKPGETVTLKPGSFHIMMMGLSKPFVAGEMVHGTLHFEKAGSIEVDFKVEAMGAEPQGQHNHMTMPSN
jgi:copper(I)-binding protein